MKKIILITISLIFSISFLNADNHIKTNPITTPMEPEAFSSGSVLDKEVSILERENYSENNIGNFQYIKKNILNPIKQNQKILFLISVLISNKYGAHG